MKHFYIAHRLYKQTRNTNTNTTIRIAIIGIVLSIVVLVLTFAITDGFSREILTKVTGLNAHIEVKHFEFNNSYQRTPLNDDPSLRLQLNSIENIAHIQAVASIAGILKGENDVEGVVFKGIGKDYDTTFLANNIIEGRCPIYSDTIVCNEILISETLAKRASLHLNDKIDVFFIQDNVRRRRFEIVGIYNTGFANFDKIYAICDIKHVIKINGWNNNCVDGLEIIIDDFNLLDKTTEDIDKVIDYNLKAENIKSRNSEIFSWITLIEQNVLVLIILIIIITAFSLISTQLTFALEHIPTIGLLKTMGARNQDIAKIFLLVSSKVLIIGVLIGDVVGFLLCVLQQYFHIVKLNPENYYVSYVPININFLHFLYIDIGILLISFLVLVFPAYWVAKRINVVNAIRLQ